jgi:hypothetical protein
LPVAETDQSIRRLEPMPRKPATNPALKLVRSRHDPGVTPPAPAGLGAPGGALWRAVCADFEISDAGERALLEQACRALDQAETCRERIAADGLMVGDRGHPLLRHETANRASAVRFLQRLGIGDEPPKTVTGRPGGGRHVGLA